MIRNYFRKVERTLSECPFVMDLKFDFTVIDLDRGYWKGTIEFKNGSNLHLFEYVTIGEEKSEIQEYRYHYQDPEEKLIFRHDNAPHHPEIETHPHHLHTPEELSPSQKPNLEDVLDKAIQLVIEQ